MRRCRWPSDLELGKGQEARAPVDGRDGPQLDCGQCGYLCQTYAEAVWSGAEASTWAAACRAARTQRKVKELVAALEPMRTTARSWPRPSVRPAGQVGFSRDRPALATLVDAHPLNRNGSEKDVQPRRARPSASDVTYEAGATVSASSPARTRSSVQVGARSPRRQPARRWSVSIDEALPLRRALLSKVDIARPSDECMMFLATRALRRRGSADSCRRWRRARAARAGRGRPARSAARLPVGLDHRRCRAC